MELINQRKTGSQPQEKEKLGLGRVKTLIKTLIVICFSCVADGGIHKVSFTKYLLKVLSPSNS